MHQPELYRIPEVIQDLRSPSFCGAGASSNFRPRCISLYSEITYLRFSFYIIIVLIIYVKVRISGV